MACENKYIMSVSTSCSTPATVSGKGCYIWWYQSYGLVGFQTNLACVKV
ncbi:hypothetical protein F383_31814 [Gossypium arboreum]|uniref:Uncharacterized protein n=1 Tax=Gossypium arboreum TaxID=29729 RepID=A0A0B0PMW3_GOSAR|nr:hypothetical protein F383_31814 [Gossypium arboreum]